MTWTFLIFPSTFSPKSNSRCPRWQYPTPGYNPQEFTIEGRSDFCYLEKWCFFRSLNLNHWFWPCSFLFLWKVLLKKVFTSRDNSCRVYCQCSNRGPRVHGVIIAGIHSTNGAVRGHKHWGFHSHQPIPSVEFLLVFKFSKVANVARRT